MESPQYLAVNAEALGMVPNADPVYLRLSDGAVLGEPTAAPGGAGHPRPLVPNALIDGVPLVTEQQAGQTPTGEIPVHAGEAAAQAPDQAPSRRPSTARCRRPPPTDRATMRGSDYG